MRITADLMTNPGPKTLFLAELRIEKEANITPTWWGLWLTWWICKPKFWRDFFWEWEHTNLEGWHTWKVQFLGFEINWQRRKAS